MDIQTYMQSIHLPLKDSHKGQNGKLLLIGGSELFHAASVWSLEIASRIVDMVFYSSVPENNELILEAKKKFWDGVIVPRGEVSSYINEANCVLIGPGMTRDEETATITNTLLSRYADKKWVIDAGALQMCDPSLLRENMLVTPHHGEFQRVFQREARTQNDVIECSKTHQHVVILVKGKEDVVASGDRVETVSGGNEGMTKGGTGDVLAGLIAALACTNDLFTSAVVGSHLNKIAGDTLYKTVGPFFNASDLVQQLPKTMNELLVRT